MGEKRFHVPLPLGGHLRQQQSPAPAALDDESVAADLDVCRSGDRLQRSEQRQFDLEVRQFSGIDCCEARILCRRGDRTALNDVTQRLVGFKVPDASAQRTVRVQRYERTAATGKDALNRQRGLGKPADVRDDGVAGELEETSPIGVAGHFENVPNAAARYPTTADLSPDTSPESA